MASLPVYDQHVFELDTVQNDNLLGIVVQMKKPVREHSNELQLHCFASSHIVIDCTSKSKPVMYPWSLNLIIHAVLSRR